MCTNPNFQGREDNNGFLMEKLESYIHAGMSILQLRQQLVWCRMVYALRRNHESGICDGESIERISSSFEKIRGSRLVEINIQKFKNLATFLKTKAKLWQTKQLELQSQEALLRQSLRDVYADDRINQFYSHRDEFFQPTASPFKQEADEYKLLMLQRGNDQALQSLRPKWILHPLFQCGQTIYSIRSTVRQVESRIRRLRTRNQGFD
eukprot:g82146.t1